MSDKKRDKERQEKCDEMEEMAMRTLYDNKPMDYTCPVMYGCPMAGGCKKQHMPLPITTGPIRQPTAMQRQNIWRNKISIKDWFEEMDECSEDSSSEF